LIELVEHTLISDTVSAGEKRYLGSTAVAKPGAFLDFCQRRSVPAWIEGPHHRLLTDVCQEAVAAAHEQQGIKVIIETPPRHGKSHIVSVMLPCFAMGTFPDFPVIITSYGAALARSKSREARNIMRDIGHDEFGVTVSSETSAVSEWQLANATSALIAAGVRGPITGRGARLGIIDDPIKDWKDAHSDLIRQGVWDWYKATFSTRIETGGSVILMMTRWHVDDLAGKLIQEFGLVGEGGDWHLIELPAIIDTKAEARKDPLRRKVGDVLWPVRWPRTEIESKRRILGTYQFDALFQQRPHQEEGNLIKRHCFRYYRQITMDVDGESLPGYELTFGDGVKERVLAQDCWSMVTCDTALSMQQQADYTAIEHWIVTPPIRGLRRRLLHNVVREHMEQPDQLPAIEHEAESAQASLIGVESASAGKAAVQHLRRRGMAIHELKAERDKLARALPLSAAYEAEQVFHLQGSPWLGIYEAELTKFPHVEHDDQADAAAYMELTLRELEDMPKPRAWTHKRDPEAEGHLRRRARRTGTGRQKPKPRVG
jgi:predicted phage terminase large subunit-like protein